MRHTKLRAHHTQQVRIQAEKEKKTRKWSHEEEKEGEAGRAAAPPVDRTQPLETALGNTAPGDAQGGQGFKAHPGVKCRQKGISS